MPKSDFIPHADHDFLVWLDQFISNLKPEHGLSEPEMAALKAANTDFHAKVSHTNDIAAMGKQATADKKTSRSLIESLVRAGARQIKARQGYTEGQGAQLGIEGPKHRIDLSTAIPDLSGIDQTGGLVVLSFGKNNSDGINIYCQRDNDADWAFLARATISPYQDNRPLLQSGKPEIRRYTAIYMQKDQETGKFSNDLVINCAP